MANIGSWIDAGDNQVDRGIDQSEQRQRNTIRGGAVAGPGLGPIGQFGWIRPERAVHCLDMAGGRPVFVRSDHCQIP